MVRGNGRGDVRRRRDHVLDRLARGDVLQHQPQSGEATANLRQHRVDEHLFAVERVHIRVGDLAVQQQRQVCFLHRLQRAETVRQLRHPRIGVGGGPGGVILHRVHQAARLRQGNLLRRGVVGEIQGHQRLKTGICGQRRQNALAIGPGQCHGSHRRAQIGHDDGARKLARSMRQYRGERGTVAQVQMPVVGAGEGKGLRCGSLHGRRNYTRACNAARPQMPGAAQAAGSIRHNAPAVIRAPIRYTPPFSGTSRRP